MRIGRRSFLFGAHQFVVHPILVWLAWKRLYGKRPTFKETIAIAVHDIGYWFTYSIDGEDGVNHPLLGASVAGRLLGQEFATLVRYHSRTLARRDGVEVSALCIPDKLAFVLCPRYLYLVLGCLSGEIASYKAVMGLDQLTDREWFDATIVLALQWAACNVKPADLGRFNNHFMRTAEGVGKAKWNPPDLVA